MRRWCSRPASATRDPCTWLCTSCATRISHACNWRYMTAGALGKHIFRHKIHVNILMYSELRGCTNSWRVQWTCFPHMYDTHFQPLHMSKQARMTYEMLRSWITKLSNTTTELTWIGLSLNLVFLKNSTFEVIEANNVPDIRTIEIMQNMDQQTAQLFIYSRWP
jgi:glutaredoxin-related protein